MLEFRNQDAIKILFPVNGSPVCHTPELLPRENPEVFVEQLRSEVERICEETKAAREDIIPRLTGAPFVRTVKLNFRGYERL